MPPRAHVSQAPTNPRPGEGGPPTFDVADLFAGPLGPAEQQTGALSLDEKLRQAYFWIVNEAIISPHYDIEYGEGSSAPTSVSIGGVDVRLPDGQCYSSFVLLPLLNFALRRRCLLVGGPGRGKTATAVLMGILAGYSVREVRRGIQHGQPQMTISDLLGNPLPADLVKAESMDRISIAWRRWLSMRVKIIDEYNRIPTRTQSALLTVMADNYAEVLDQIFECPDAAWYLTANDDKGGGTYQVIEALKDRIDVVVKALAFNSRFMGELLVRIEEGRRPEQMVPAQLIFTTDEIDEIERQIQQVRLPPGLLRRLSFFSGQFEFCAAAGEQLEYRTKDTLQLAGEDFGLVDARDTSRDRLLDPGSQTKNGLSVRAMLTAMAFVKAMAWFRGSSEVELEDLRQILPFVLHDKLKPNHDAPWFEAEGHQVYRIDKISWLRALFDMSCRQYDQLGLDQEDPIERMAAELEQGLDGLDEATVDQRLAAIEQELAKLAEGGHFHAWLFDGVQQLKYMHQRYTNYRRWLRWKG